MRWDVLPEGFAVHPKDPTNGKNILPLSFEPNGRARIANAYVTILVYSKDEWTVPAALSDGIDNDGDTLIDELNEADEGPNPDYCRYLRVFRNTGRVVTARTIDALPE